MTKECPVCSFSYDGLSGHQKSVHGRTHRTVWHKAWNAGLTSKTDERVRLRAIQAGITLTGHAGHPHSQEFKNKQSVIAKERKLGGYRGGGKGKKGRYKGFWCDSSWELAWVLYSINSRIRFKRNWKRFKYINHKTGTTHTYLPDFCTDECYIEIKGWVADKELLDLKLASTDKPVRLLTEVEMKPILDWVIKTYGKGFTNLYNS